MRWHIHRVPLGNCTHHVFRLHEGKWVTEGGGRPNCSDVLRSLYMQFATCVCAYICVYVERKETAIKMTWQQLLNVSRKANVYMH